MPETYDLLVRGGLVGDRREPHDVAIADGVVAAVEPELSPGAARAVVDAVGCRVLPGLVDPHVHVSGRFGSPVGFGMLARAGVVAALDLAGDASDLAETLPRRGCGLTVGAIFPLIPGDTVSSADASERELETILDRELERGAIGLKVLGGHFPLSPDATRATIELCARRGAYCAVHAGTTETGSDVTGVEELVELAGGLPVHVAHVNSYCRGQIDDPTAEAARAIAALASSDAAWSESYLSLLNGAEARCVDGVPLSHVVQTCLRLGGYEQTQGGIEQAISDGWARIQAELEDEVGFLEPEDGLARFRATGTDTGISFPVNPPAASVALAVARDREGAFAVDAFGSDGGSIPRNTTLTQALGLVAGRFMTIGDLIHKASAEPARRLGLERKGRLEPGADADVVVVDASASCRHTIIGGRQIVRDGVVVEHAGGTVLRAC